MARQRTGVGGNGAWDQHQLDNYGALLDAAYTLRHQLGEMDESTRLFLIAAVRAAATMWNEDDQGIWEMRGAARPFLHSKLMCWVALDRGVLIAEQLRLEDSQVADWTRVRDEIGEAILTRGWSDRARAFTQSFGSDELDASTLLMAIVGFFDPSDPKLLSTIDARAPSKTSGAGFIGIEVATGSTHQRARSCCARSGWLTRWRLPDRWSGRGKPSPQPPGARPSWDCLPSRSTQSRAAIGNFPQTFTHLGLVNAAQALADAEARSAETAPPGSDLVGG